MIDSNLMNEIREAAAQGKTSLHEGNECRTCGGDGYVMAAKIGIGTFSQTCPHCKGTGKDNAK